MSNPPTFVRASRLYDVDERERVLWDWDRGQPLAESQAEIEEAMPRVR